MNDNSDPYRSFLESLFCDLGSAPKTIDAEKIVRFDDVDGKPGNNACWAILFLGDNPAGAYGNWKTGSQFTWHLRNRKNITDEDRQQLRARIELAKARREADISKIQAQAIIKAERIWSESRSASVSHPYLVKKKIQPYSARQKGNLLILPIIDNSGTLVTLQFISPNGEKKLLSGGRKHGNHIPINEPNIFSRLLICEGFATGATLAEGEPTAKVIAAVDAGNLEIVTLRARADHPDLEIVICADADPVGIEKARKAAIKAGADMAVPEFPAGIKGTDFNDLVSLAGGA